MVGITTFETKLFTTRIRRRAWCTRYNVAAVVDATRGIARLFVMANIDSSDDAEWIDRDGERADRWGELGSGVGGKFYCPKEKNLIEETSLISRQKK